MSTHRKAGEPKTKIEVWLQDYQQLRYTATQAMLEIQGQGGHHVLELKRVLDEADQRYGEIPRG